MARRVDSRRESASRGPLRRPVAATIVFVVLITGGTLPIPLYRLWTPELHLGAVETVFLFVAYAVGVVGALLLLGGASDHAGRRYLMLAALVSGGASTALFIVPASFPSLLAGRLLSGVATGITVPAATAWISDFGLSRRLAASVSAACNFGGFAVGSLLAGTLSQLLGSPTPVFFVYLVMLAAVTPLVLALPETVDRRSGTRLPRPSRPALPGRRRARAAFLGATSIAAAAFAVNGTYSSLVPEFVRQALSIDANAVIGALVALLFASSLVSQSFMPQRVVRSPVLVVVLLLVGTIGVQVSLLTEVLPTFLLATGVAGAGIGWAVRRGLAVTGEESSDSARAGLNATYYLGTYLGLIVPTLVVGALEQTAGRVASTSALTAAVLVGSVVGLLLSLHGDRPGPRRSP